MANIKISSLTFPDGKTYDLVDSRFGSAGSYVLNNGTLTVRREVTRGESVSVSFTASGTISASDTVEILVMDVMGAGGTFWTTSKTGNATVSGTWTPSLSGAYTIYSRVKYALSTTGVLVNVS